MLTAPISGGKFQAVEFSWDLEGTGMESPLLSAGVVSIRPATGILDAGQSMLFQVTVSAACGPQMLGQRPVACLIRQVPPTTVSIVNREVQWGAGHVRVSHATNVSVAGSYVTCLLHHHNFE